MPSRPWSRSMASLDEKRALYQSMRGACDIHRERGRLRVLRPESDALFAEIEVEADTEAA